MRHKKKRLQLNRFTSWHEATIKSLARNILIYQSIKTSLSKAKAARPLTEELIRLAKENTLSAKRRAFQVLQDHLLVKALFNEIGPRFVNRASGYTRIINLGARRGDDAPMVIFELMEIKKKEIKKTKKDKAKEASPDQEGVVDVTPKEQTPEARPHTTDTAVKEKPPITKKPPKKFLGGIRNIFKKERDSL